MADPKTNSLLNMNLGGDNQSAHQSTSDILNNFLSDNSAVDALAVANNRGNTLATEGYGADLLSLSYGQLAAKYGKDVADNRHKIQEGIQRNNSQRNADRSTLQTVGDTVVGAEAGLAGIVGGIAGLGLAVTGFDETAVKANEYTQNVVQDLVSNQSQELQDRNRLQAIESELDEVDRDKQYIKDVATDGEFLASLKKAGSTVLDTADRITNDGAVVGDIISQAVGSLGPSAKIASLVSNLAVKGSAKLTANKALQAKAATIGAGLGVGISEGSGVYSETVTAVMGMDPNDLIESSEPYRDLLNSGLSQEEAQIKLATSTGVQAFTRHLPVATALGLISSKFETSPIGTFVGADLISGLKNIGLQTLEEGLQGGTGALNQNLALQDQVDENTDLSDGVAENVVTGVIAGAGMSSALAVPGTSVNIAGKTYNLGSDIKNSPTTAKIASKVVSSTGKAIADTLDKADPLVKPTVAASKAAANKVVEVAKPVTDKIQDSIEKTNPTTQNELIAVSQSVETLVQDLVKTKAKDTTLPEQVSKLGVDIDSSPVPKSFAKNVSSTGTLIENVTGILKSFTEKEVNINRIPDTDVLYAAKRFQDLKNTSVNLPDTIKGQVTKLLTSPDMARIQKRASKIDLNATQSADTEVTSSNIEETLSVAQINPANVNAEFVSKILNHKDRSKYSPEKIKLLETAMKIATAINNHVGEQVKISEDKSIALSQKPNYKGKAPVVLDGASVSRSINVGGFQDKVGTKLRSINDFAADIFRAAQDPKGIVINAEGVEVSGKSVAQQFGLFVTHLNNKVGALNESFDNNNKLGNGPKVHFESLVAGRKLLPAGSKGGSRPVAYHSSSPNSTEFASTVHNDATVAAEVYNAVLEAFPDLFDGSSVTVPALKKLGETKQESTTAVEDESGALAQGSDEQTSSETGIEAQFDPETPGGRDNPVEIETKKDLEVIAEQIDENPSDAQKEAENYNQGHGIIQGLKVTIENAKGTERTGTDGDGETWSVTMPADYGKIKGTLGADGDQVDVYIGGNPASQEVHIVNQYDPQTGKFDEHKVILGANTLDEATAIYDAGFSDGSGPARRKSVAITDIDGLKQWLETGDQNLEYSDVETSDQDLETASDEAIQKEEEDYSHLPERFSNAYTPSGDTVEYTDAGSLLSLLESQEGASKEYLNFARIMLRPLMASMNKRLQTVKFRKSDQRSIAQVIKDSNTDLYTYREFKNTLIVDPLTQKYDPKLLGLASLAVIDWLTSVQSSHPGQLDDTLEDLGVKQSSLTDDELAAITSGVPPRQAAENIARQVIRMWNMQSNPDAPMVDTRGIAEGVVKELITVLSQGGKLITLDDIPIRVDGELKTAQTINVKKLKSIQKSLGSEGKGSIQRLLMPDLSESPSFGEKIQTTDKLQTRGGVVLSKLEKKALKAMQDTPHYIAQGISTLVEQIGFTPMADMLGFTDLEEFTGNQTLRNSVIGKNLSIDRDFTDALAVVESIRNHEKEDTQVDVYYPVGISKVGRHQFKGVNPQSNKLLRAMVTPTHSELDMTTKADQDAFWLTVAQAADIAGVNKVENQNHQYILENIQGAFDSRFGEAVTLVESWLKDGNIDGAALAEAMGANIEVAQLNAVMAVAEYNDAKSRGKEATFKTTLSFELDGKTDGPANMMMNFGQGILRPEDLQNFNRVGLFLGKVGATLNKYFSATNSAGKSNVDLYEVTSKEAEREMFRRIAKSKNSDKAVMYAAGRFAAYFGDLRIEDNQIHMTRNTSKNPMTKTVYGSGVRGVASGIADDMVLEFYRKLTTVPNQTDLAEFFGYPNLENDISLLFGHSLPDELSPQTFEFSETALKRFEDVAVKGIGDILSSSAKKVIGDKITEVNDLLVFITGVQSKFISNLFEERLKAVIAEQVASGKIKGKAELSQRDYNAVIQEVSAYVSAYSNGSQTLVVGGFKNDASDTELSASMDRTLRQTSSLYSPVSVGVKVIPYLSIGRGDAMMMNTIYGADNAPTDTLPVFDGIDMPVNQVKNYSKQINEAVMKNWDRDILGDVVADFERFLKHADPTLVEAAFLSIKKSSKDTSVIADNSADLFSDLKKAQSNNLARKRAFRRIPLSVDHMGGSDIAYTRGENLELPDGLQGINKIIREELAAGEPVETLPKGTSYEELNTASGEVMVKSLLKTTKNKSIRQAMRAIKGMLPSDMTIITGSVEQLNAQRDDGQIIEANGSFDPDSKTLYLANNSHETLTHELIHAATFEQVLQHYQGTANEVVVRLEALMNEFLSLKLQNLDKATKDAYTSAVLEINLQNSAGTPLGQARALNEFMAWTLSNEHLAKTLKNTESKIFASLTKRVLNLMRRLMGSVSSDMFSQILFNTKLLDVDPPIDNGEGGDNGNGGDNNDGGEVTPPVHRFHNFWIDLVREKLAAARSSNKPATETQVLSNYTDQAQLTINALEFGGFSLSAYQKQTFKAIHVVLATEMRLDSASAVALNNMFEYVTDNLTPEMFGPDNGATRYAAVMDLFGKTKNKQDVSDAVAVLLALSQTSRGFREALDQLPEPEAQTINAGSLNEFLSTLTGFLMRKAVGSIDTAGPDMKATLDNLAESIIRQDSDKEYTVLRGLMHNIDRADEFVSGAFSKLAERTATLANDVLEGDRSTLTKTLVGGVSLATNFLSESRSEIAKEGLLQVTHMGINLDKFVSAREFVSEVIGTTKTNAETVALLDRTNSSVSAARQAYREDLPVILQNQFTKHPDESQWKALHKVLGKGDFSAVFDLAKPDNSMNLIAQPGYLNSRITRSEKAIRNNYSRPVADEILIKAQQLADFMNGNGAGHQLLRNAHAINTLAGEYKQNMTKEIDQLVSLYAVQGSDSSQRDQVTEMYREDPEGVKAVLTYIQALNKEEDLKVISDAAKLNGYKGFIPDAAAKGARLVIEADVRKDEMIKMGFTRLGDYTAEDAYSVVKRGYYFTTVKNSGTYSQGVLQTVQDSYRGVDATTGLSITGDVSGVISGESADRVTQELNRVIHTNNKETLMPVYDDDGAVLHYERAINPDLIEEYLKPKSNLALMLGSWAGRQVEEKFAQQYNRELVIELKKIYDKRDTGTDNLFINVAAWKQNDKITQDSWRIISPQTKNHIASVFGDDMFMVRKDMLNLALGYREASILDYWTGKTRMPKVLQTTVQAVATRLLGQRAVTILSKTEDAVQATVSSAKDLIVVRSLVVPYMNTQANVVQLATKGVGTKDMIRGYRDKLNEIEAYNENVTKVIELETLIQLSGNDKNRVRILRDQIQVINDQTARMTIAPLIEAGAYKNISEGITDLDVDLSSGRLGEWVEGKLNLLPGAVQTIAKYGLLSKDTAIYKGANKAVQYGDFIAKGILFDHYTQRKGLSETDALRLINEEFVNFSVLPGRTRSALERMGLSWFMTFKIRIMKIALGILRDNPARAMIVANTVGDFGSPVADNLATVVAQDRLDYSLGWDMLFGSPELNPWVNMIDWAGD